MPGTDGRKGQTGKRGSTGQKGEMGGAGPTGSPGVCHCVKVRILSHKLHLIEILYWKNFDQENIKFIFLLMHYVKFAVGSQFLNP